MKSKSKSQRKVNFNNPKVDSIISHMVIAEGRISKSTILKYGNKDILYSLKNEGYIKESSKGMYSPTSKMRKHIQKNTGKHISSSNSLEHSQKIENSLNLVPVSVISNRNYNTAYDIEQYFNKYVRNSSSYKEIVTATREHINATLTEAYANHKAFVSTTTDDATYFAEKIRFTHERDTLVSQKNIWDSSKPYLIPDYSLTFTQSELDEYISNLRDEYSICGNELILDTLNKLSSLDFKDTITIDVEVIGNSYHDRELTMHKNYEILSGRPLIFL